MNYESAKEAKGENADSLDGQIARDICPGGPRSGEMQRINELQRAGTFVNSGDIQ